MNACIHPLLYSRYAYIGWRCYTAVILSNSVPMYLFISTYVRLSAQEFSPLQITRQLPNTRHNVTRNRVWLE